MGFGVRHSRHLFMESINPQSGQVRLITDFGPIPASMRFGELNGMTSFRGFSISPDGKSILTSIFRSTSDIWMMEGFR